MEPSRLNGVDRVDIEVVFLSVWVGETPDWFTGQHFQYLLAGRNLVPLLRWFKRG
jgi:hypothetical protein